MYESGLPFRLHFFFFLNGELINTAMYLGDDMHINHGTLVVDYDLERG